MRERLTLQDHLFAPSDSSTLPAHLYLVSASSATCHDLDPMQCLGPELPGSDAADSGSFWVRATGSPAVRVGRHHLVLRTTG